MKQSLYLFGAGVQARVLADLVRWKFSTRYELTGCFDDHKAKGSPVDDALVVRGDRESGILRLEEEPAAVLIAFGTKAWMAGWEMYKQLLREDVEFARLIPDDAFVSPSAQCGQHAVMMPGVFIGAHTRLGDMVMIHGGAAIEHDVAIGNHVLVGPGVSVASGVIIEDHVLLGAGCSIAPGVRIEKGALVGAGATVIHDLPSDAVCYGSPATPIRNRSENDPF